MQGKNFLVATAALTVVPLFACSVASRNEAHPGVLGVVQRGELCAKLTPVALAELAGVAFDDGRPTPAQPGREDGCFAASPESGLVLSAEVWSGHGDLERDLLRLGSPAARTPYRQATVAGLPALTATAEVDGRQYADLAVHVDDCVLVVLVQRFSAMADGATEADDAILANAIAERLLDPEPDPLTPTPDR